ncbi:MAG: ABC transporter permease, partial [Bacteroidetes bacterium]|nr:ABC transporter permease [Bacteroidota bacterium]
MRGIVAFLRRLSRDGLFSVVNIGGLSIGMAATLLIMLWVYNQWSFDRFFAKDKFLYKLWCYDQEEGNFDAVSTEIGPALLDEVAGISNISRYGESEVPFSFSAEGELQFSLNSRHAVAATVDTCFLRMFSFKLLRGDLATVFADPFSMVVTLGLARRIFGDEDPMGQTVSVYHGAINLKVTGVLADLPPNTAFRFDLLVPYKTFSLSSGWYGRSRNNLTFVELASHAEVKEVDASIREIISQHTGGHSRTRTYLQHISKWHLYNEFDRGLSVGGRIKTLRMYGWIALLILTIACINFMNLTTAQSAKRSKEAQVRKVIGLTRVRLIISSLGESMLLTALAGLFALLWVSMALPLFHAIVGDQFHLDFGKVVFWIVWGVFTGLTGLLAGGYPSFCFGRGFSLVSLRKILIVTQFSFAVILITATMVIQRQLHFVYAREVGYNPSRLVSVEVNDHSRPTCEQVRRELLATGVAESVSINFGSMVGSESRVTAFEYLRWRGMDPESTVVFERNYALQDWAQTTGLHLVKGRDIDIVNHPGDSTAMLLNETAVQVMGLEDPIGEMIFGGGG